jgi:hypothetical protein
MGGYYYRITVKKPKGKTPLGRASWFKGWGGGIFALTVRFSVFFLSHSSRMSGLLDKLGHEFPSLIVISGKLKKGIIFEDYCLPFHYRQTLYPSNDRIWKGEVVVHGGTKEYHVRLSVSADIAQFWFSAKLHAIPQSCYCLRANDPQSVTCPKCS